MFEHSGRVRNASQWAERVRRRTHLLAGRDEILMEGARARNQRIRPVDGACVHIEREGGGIGSNQGGVS